MNFTSVIIIIISGFFLNVSLELERIYKKSKENLHEDDNYYFEAYVGMRVIAILELILGTFFYIKDPMPLFMPMPNFPMEIVYHSMIWLMSIILGAWLFDKFYDRIK